MNQSGWDEKAQTVVFAWWTTGDSNAETLRDKITAALAEAYKQGLLKAERIVRDEFRNVYRSAFLDEIGEAIRAAAEGNK